MKMPMFDYELGCAKLDKLDFACISNFNSFLTTSGGGFYKKDVCYKIATAYYLQNNLPKATEYINKIKTIGSAETDADKLALTFYEKRNWSNKELIKTRIVADGGNLQLALKIINAIKTTDLITINDKVEHSYRYARIYDELEQDDKAILYYLDAIEKGKNETSYFAARAALQTGFIYEKKGQNAQAITFFKKVLDFKNKEYKNSLDQRAKAGITRLQGG
jgi:tetratricopeptide (TPR) repeat protein